MKQLLTGQFYGQTNETFHLDGITLTDTEYTHSKVDWHYHQNPYFTFILEGNVIEGNKKETYHCSAGTLLFHNWQEPHYNIKPDGFTRGFHIELEQKWIDHCAISLNSLQGNIHLADPSLKLLLYKIFQEMKINDTATPLSINSLLLQTLAGMQCAHQALPKAKSGWVKELHDLLHDQCTEKLSLNELSKTLGIHPVHLSRQFSQYFHCSFGEYVRRLKVEKSLSLLSNKKYSLTEITFECGFCDQSHFTRNFKAQMGISPLAYRRLLFR